jgi:hypothetical protein
VRALLKLSNKSGLYPECLKLQGVQISGRDAVAGGSYGDIWKGCIDSHVIAIKVMRVFGVDDVQKVLKVFRFRPEGNVRCLTLMTGIFARGCLVATALPSECLTVLWGLSLER